MWKKSLGFNYIIGIMGVGVSGRTGVKLTHWPEPSKIVELSMLPVGATRVSVWMNWTRALKKGHPSRSDHRIRHHFSVNRYASSFSSQGRFKCLLSEVTRNGSSHFTYISLLFLSDNKWFLLYWIRSEIAHVERPSFWLAQQVIYTFHSF